MVEKARQMIWSKAKPQRVSTRTQGQPSPLPSSALRVAHEFCTAALPRLVLSKKKNCRYVIGNEHSLYEYGRFRISILAN
jgi:hypothetical protein